MKVNGLTIWLMVTAFICIVVINNDIIYLQVGLNTKGNGRTICNMARVSKNGLMAPSTKVYMRAERKTERVNSTLLMVVFTKETL